MKTPTTPSTSSTAAAIEPHLRRAERPLLPAGAALVAPALRHNLLHSLIRPENRPEPPLSMTRPAPGRRNRRRRFTRAAQAPHRLASHTPGCRATFLRAQPVLQGVTTVTGTDPGASSLLGRAADRGTSRGPRVLRRLRGTRSTRLLRTAYLLTHDRALAEDLVQTSLAKAWFAWARIEGQPDAYVRRVMVNTYSSWWRRRWNGEEATAELPERGARSGHRPAEAADIAWGLAFFWLVRGHAAEGLRWNEQILNLPSCPRRPNRKRSWAQRNLVHAGRPRARTHGAHGRWRSRRALRSRNGRARRASTRAYRARRRK